MDKSRLREALVTALERELDVLVRAAHMARDEATSPESKPENKYDTRGQEAAYLAGSQAKMATELAEDIAMYRQLPLPAWNPAQPVDIGALAELESRGRRSWIFYGPKQGGLELELEGTPVVVVTPQSPLGSQLRGKLPGATVQLPGRTGIVTHKLLSIV
ncbi:MAG: transcription elongation factor [Opitutaceae bacterium]|nr:transcription elongation factor [Opitutaceae bacterium]